MPLEEGQQKEGIAPEQQPLDGAKPIVQYNSLRSLLLPFYLPTMLLHLARSLVLVVLPLEVMALGYSYHEVGSLGAILGVGIVIGNIPAGKIVSATGPRGGMLVACLGFALAAGMAIL